MKFQIAVGLLVLAVLVAACDPSFYGTEGMNATNQSVSNGTNVSTSSMQNATTTNASTGSQAISQPAAQTAVAINTTGHTVNQTYDTSSLPGSNVKSTDVATFIEGDLVKIIDTPAKDPDGDDLTYTFTRPLNATGVWQTKEGDAGRYEVTITANDGKAISTKTVTFEVLPLNRRPVISGLADITVNEGETIRIRPTITDADGDEVTVTYSGFMTTDTYTTKYTDAGVHQVTIAATDGKATSTQTIKVTITDVNRKPVIKELKVNDVVEGETVSVAAVAEDADGDKVTITYGTPLDSNGVWKTVVGDAGVYNIPVTFNDGKDTVVQTITLRVAAANKAPVISNFFDITVGEGEAIQFNPIVTDADGDDVTFTYSGFMTTNRYQTTYDDAGVYKVTLTATDGKVSVTRTVTVTILDRNRPPVFQDSVFDK
jgi:VCBS repeat-containing protein